MLIPSGDYRRWDAVEMARLVRDGEVTADDLAETARAMIEDLRGLNAVASLAEAGPGAAGADPGAGGALAGVPFAVKELLAWPGLPWTMGSRLMAASPAPALSPYAARIAGSGLNVICSTASSEFGLLGSTESALHGPTLNPWGEGLSTGGSSGGSAALVAAGIVPMAHGSDGGGSLRGPAALTGIFGFKPSNRRCAAVWPDAPGFASLAVEHCMSRSVRDNAAFLAATERTGGDAIYPPVGPIAAPEGRRLRISLLTSTLAGREPDEPVARELGRAAALCERLGHHVEAGGPPEIDGPALSDAFFTSAALAISRRSANAARALGRPPGPAELEPFTLELIEWAATFGPDAPAVCEEAFAKAGRAYRTLFERCDVVLSPTLPRVSWPMGSLAPGAGRETLIPRTEEMAGYTAIHNLAGCPAMTVPLGRHDGLPVGIHFAARPGADGLLLGLARELEEAAPWADTRPDLAWLA
jgi:amidase